MISDQWGISEINERSCIIDEDADGSQPDLQRSECNENNFVAKGGAPGHYMLNVSADNH